ncbi:hypothetical protein BH11MYX1_BH11MYX1_35940 [soil metagenome]
MIATGADLAAMRAHGWELWQHLAGGDHLAWERWAPTERMFAAAPVAQPKLRAPRPFRHGDTLETESLPVMFDVLFDPHAARHVRVQHLNERKVLDTLAELPAFPSDATAVKLTWSAVHAHGLTAMPIWDGEPANPDGDGNPDRSLQRAIAVEPDRTVIPDGELAEVTLGKRAFHAKVVPLSAFIVREFASDDLENARRAAHDPALVAGDHVALVAVHVSTKEISDWTWQTYWWHDAPSEGRFAAGRPVELHGVAANYLMDVTYSAGTPCFNPWLEARFPDGQTSNCVTCHQRAMVGAADYLPVTHVRLHDDDPYFEGHIQTDFVWSVAFEAR